MVVSAIDKLSHSLTYDAAIAKFEKIKNIGGNAKKDKERKDVEDEYEKAKFR